MANNPSNSIDSVTSEGIKYREDKELPEEQVVALYQALGWSSAEKPEQLMAGLRGSHRVISAWHGDRLVGIGSAISDGALVVYYPHLCVHPDYQRLGVGRQIMRRMTEHYAGFHQQQVVADSRAIGFYEKCGFEIAGSCQPLWIYGGHDHD
ncbi:MAG: GNAT family N-acetyltransferase [Verrucomicrobiota bacterium]